MPLDGFASGLHISGLDRVDDRFVFFDHLFGAADRKNALQVAHPVHFAFGLIDDAPGAGQAGCSKDRSVKFFVEQEEVGEFLQALDEHDDVHRVWAAVK